MSQKMWCPGCTSYTSSVWLAVGQGEPCPHCGLAAGTITSVNELRQRREDDALTEQVAELLIERDRLLAEVAELRGRLDDVRRAVLAAAKVAP